MKDELTLHPYSSYVTLTYAPKSLPDNKFIITNDWDLSDEELIAMMYDLSCDCPLCKNKSNC